MILYYHYYHFLSQFGCAKLDSDSNLYPLCSCHGEDWEEHMDGMKIIPEVYHEQWYRVI